MVIFVNNFAGCNILHYSSTKSRRVTRSVLATELFAYDGGFDYWSMIRDAYSDIYGFTVTLDIWVDAKCLSNYITGLNTTT